MLNHFRTGAFALAAAMTLTTTAAEADNHVVLIVDGSYFPNVIFARAGDNIIFRNESDASHTISGPNDSWTSGQIASADTYRLNLTRNTPATFTGTGGGFEEAFGEIIFDALPEEDS